MLINASSNGAKLNITTFTTSNSISLPNKVTPVIVSIRKNIVDINGLELGGSNYNSTLIPVSNFENGATIRPLNGLLNYIKIDSANGNYAFNIDRVNYSSILRFSNIRVFSYHEEDENGDSVSGTTRLPNTIGFSPSFPNDIDTTSFTCMVAIPSNQITEFDDYVKVDAIAFPIVNFPHIYEVSYYVAGGDVLTTGMIASDDDDLTIEQINAVLSEDNLIDLVSINYVGQYYCFYNGTSVPLDYSMNFTTNTAKSPYQPGGTSTPGGGGGNFGVGVPNDNVVQDIPTGSNFGYVGGSIFTHYVLSGNQVENFGEWLWTDNLGLSLWKRLMEKIFNETADGLISLMCFPFTISNLPYINLVDGTIIAGNLNTGVPARILGSPFVQVDWGTIQLTEYWGNFLDYAPHTKIELYLPWCTGFVSLDPHQCLPGSLVVKTNIDLQKGTCTHIVSAGTTVIGVYEGQVGYEIPLLASNFSAKLAGATVAAVTALGMTAMAASVGAKTAMAANRFSTQMQMFKANSGITDPQLIGSYSQAMARHMAPNIGKMEQSSYNALTNVTPAKLASLTSSAVNKAAVTVQRNGSFSGSSAGSSIQYPFVIISRPKQDVPAGYGHHFGYPSNLYRQLMTLRGYTEIGAIHLTGLNAMPDEIAELDEILKGGFII